MSTLNWIINVSPSLLHSNIFFHAHDTDVFGHVLLIIPKYANAGTFRLLDLSFILIQNGTDNYGHEKAPILSCEWITSQRTPELFFIRDVWLPY